MEYSWKFILRKWIKEISNGVIDLLEENIFLNLIFV